MTCFPYDSHKNILKNPQKTQVNSVAICNKACKLLLHVCDNYCLMSRITKKELKYPSLLRDCSARWQISSFPCHPHCHASKENSSVVFTSSLSRVIFELVVAIPTAFKEFNNLLTLLDLGKQVFWSFNNGFSF